MSLIFWSHRWTTAVLVSGVVLSGAIAGCSPGTDEPAMNEPETFPMVDGYQPMTIPADNPMTAAKVTFGKQLYYDTRLSGDGERSCYSCHVSENGLTDGRALAIGAFDRTLTRSAPTMWNVGYHEAWYWDGRASTLEGQALAAWRGGNMGASGNDGAPSVEDVCTSLDGIAAYSEQFQSVFGAACTPENVSKALAAFMRTIVTTSETSAWIRFRNGDTTAISEAAQRGYALFNEKAGCATCHSGLLLTDLQYHNVGIGMDAEEPDLGRFRATEADQDRGAFKTPTLIDISKSAPYFHDGSVATLEQAVDQMLAGGLPNANLDVNLKPVQLTPQERAELLEFLRALDANYTVAPPSLPQ